jgi:hypothetical protein
VERAAVSGPLVKMFFDRGIMSLWPGLWPTQGDQKRLPFSNDCPWKPTLPFVISTGAYLDFRPDHLRR